LQRLRVSEKHSASGDQPQPRLDEGRTRQPKIETTSDSIGSDEPMKVADWLRNLGLEQYEAAFRENVFDADILPTLTGEELKDIEALASEQQLSLTIEPDFIRGTALVRQGAADEGVVRIRQGLTKWRQKRATLYLPFGLALLADALARYGEHAATLAAVGEGLEGANRRAPCWFRPWRPVASAIRYG
jgi:SAM domain (Sterile alpha motif)